MNIKFFTGSTDFPDYLSITSATNTQKTSAGREAAARLEAGVSSERVLSLKQQVESGTYRPDARRIAEKLLGYR